MNSELELEILDDMIHQAQDSASNPEDKEDFSQMVIALNRISTRQEVKQEKGNGK